MCCMRGLGDPNVLVCCGMTAHARKVSTYMFFVFIVIFAIGAFVLRNDIIGADPSRMILFWYCCGNVILLSINFFGVLCCCKLLLFPGFLVHGSLVIIMTILTAELGLAVVFPNWKAPSPLLGYYLNIHLLQLGKNWLMRLIGALITLNLFFLTQIPTTAFIAQLKIWKEITISEEYEKSPRVTIISMGDDEEKGELPSPDLMIVS